MKLFSILVILLGLTELATVHAEAPQPDESEKELKRLEGTWKLISHKGSKRDRELAEDETFGKRELVIKGNEWTEKRIGQKEGQTKKFSVDPIKSPKTLDLVYKVGDKVYTQRPIYVLEGGKLTVLFSSRGSHIRPDGLQDPRTNLYIYERVKK